MERNDFDFMYFSNHMVKMVNSRHNVRKKMTEKSGWHPENTLYRFAKFFPVRDGM